MKEEVDSGYSSKIAVVYLFNLIVGVGALTLPKVFAETGWVLGIIALGTLALMSYCTSTFMIEAMSIGNAVLLLKKNKKQANTLKDDLTVNGNNEDSDEVSSDEVSPLLVEISSGEEVLDLNMYAINRKVEMGELAGLFFNKAGLVAYYIVIVLYLYGDLAIYAAAVPKSLTQVICGGGSEIFHQGSDPCQNVNNVSVLDMYRIMLLVFTVCLCPFVFFNLAKTKFLQVATTIFRWLAFSVMVILAARKIGQGKSTHRAKMFDLQKLPNFFGVAIYSFMCQHSLPSIITPVINKKRVNFFILLDFIAVASFYSLLVLTAVFAFKTTELQDLYTLSFTVDVPDVLKYFLELFPVFTLTTSFPIIGITLRENLKTLFLKEDQLYGLFVRSFLFPLLTVIPPVIIAFATDDVGFLVNITGTYAGAIIQYVVPVMLVFFGRRHIFQQFGNYENNNRSPFGHIFWIFLIIVWYLVCLIFVSVDKFL